MVKYFVKNGERTHKYPVPNNCNVHYNNEKLYDSPPKGIEKCDHCFNLPK